MLSIYLCSIVYLYIYAVSSFGTVAYAHVCDGAASQTRRLNWARIALVAQFIRSTAAMTSDLRLSIIPVLDSIFELLGLTDRTLTQPTNPWCIFNTQFLIPMGTFVNTRYFQSLVPPPGPSSRTAAAAAAPNKSTPK
jgi:hypothetical protein